MILSKSYKVYEFIMLKYSGLETKKFDFCLHSGVN